MVLKADDLTEIDKYKKRKRLERIYSSIVPVKWEVAT